MAALLCLLEQAQWELLQGEEAEDKEHLSIA